MDTELRDVEIPPGEGEMMWHENELRDQMHKDPASWEWGIFYFNKKDDRLFVPKKSPEYGATINFARPASLLIFMVPVLLVLLLVIVYAISS